MKIIALSDTHGYYSQVEVPDGDVLVFAGDATAHGRPIELTLFLEWFEEFPHPHKIVIAGNHDRCYEVEPKFARAHFASAIYLQDEEVIIDGIKFYGSPWTPEYYNWAFMLPRGPAIADKWKLIPEDTDVLITHGPPHGILDTRINTTVATGCEELFKYYNVAICNRDYMPVNPVTEIEI